MGKHFWPIYIAVASISCALVWRFAPALGECLPTGVRDRICAALSEADIESRYCWKPMSLQAPYRDGTVSPVSNDLFERGLCLPGGVVVGSEEYERVVKVLRSV